MELLRPTRRALAGALIGVVAAAVAILLAGPAGGSAADVGLPVLAIALVGLGLGSAAATYCYVAGAAVLVLAAVLRIEPAVAAAASVVPLAVYLVGSPLIVLFQLRMEHAHAAGELARHAAEGAGHEADAERKLMVEARELIDRERAAAERDRARLEEVAEAIPEPLVVYDDRLHGTYGNRAALRLFGRSFVERSVDDWGRAVEPRDERGIPLTRDNWPQVRAQAAPIRQRVAFRIPMSGRDVLVDVEGTPIPGGGCVLLMRDVGKEEDERRRLSRFASFVAHELRNPLAVAKARIELTQRDPDVPPRAASHGVRALESVDAAIGILERLELYSRADAGRLEAARVAFSLLPAVEAGVERLRARGCARDVIVRMPDGVDVVGDRHLAEQAITNLLINADRYSVPGGAIRVEVEDGNPVTLRVVDDGPGIADGVAERLFHERVTAGRGLGLGLYLVHASMQAVGGSVQLEQRRPRAVFALRWPRSES